LLRLREFVALASLLVRDIGHRDSPQSHRGILLYDLVSNRVKAAHAFGLVALSSDHQDRCHLLFDGTRLVALATTTRT
jgi:hypothetical protein